MSFQFMDPATLGERLDNGTRTVIVDIRDPNSFAAGNISGSLHLDNENVQAFIEQNNKSQPVVVCCYHGNSSQSAAQFLFEQGFTEVYSLNGGYEQWKVSFPQHCS
ncbi:thiosulfate sulfurtransferase GlpE [Oceanospirillum beijerinckii]|uniref:thiosulfate sulfurtransferase GlpE n=1 Tax=Oceanospirillum beijerinckii TaxID=64976 RepID=UPI0004243C79|nr:thiosulfate sulfurtransferase GlpE [Oceanospirillum beijerinckii]MAC46069.1 thiosulfate sulfurtransferase GlpE [Oceanospirillum sp.]